MAQLLDLAEELEHRDRGVGGPAFAQVVAVGVDQGGPVAWCPAQGLGLAGACIPPDGVEGQVQAAGAFEQADALAEEVVDLVPALAGGLLVRARDGRGLRWPGMSCGSGPRPASCRTGSSTGASGR
ncbi:hypothetical protein GCM10010339_83490 [Streptomyces alanosinicus]|uniref:Uncharacterized protein n=1 Tax=Streptomyces alanosinicus TaxID=68171 RepID=A0A918YSZ0_9ACTN|nr:hypothetical protein GCM10010339_83490 [Streptomyces alanosinicus]